MRELGRTLSEEARKEIDELRKAADETRARLVAAKKLKGDNPCESLDHFDYMSYMESASMLVCSPPGKYHTSYTIDTKFGRTYQPLDFVAVKYGKGQEVPGQILGIYTELDSDRIKVTVRLHHGLDWKSPHGEDVITLSQDAPIIVSPTKLGRVLNVRIAEGIIIGKPVETTEYDSSSPWDWKLVKTYRNTIKIHPEMLMEGWEHHEETEPIKLVEVASDLEKLALRDSFVKDNDTLYYCVE
jgi:hypothetical protein